MHACTWLRLFVSNTQCPFLNLTRNFTRNSRVVQVVVYDSSSLKHKKHTTEVPVLNLTALLVKWHRFSNLMARRRFVFSYFYYFTKRHCFVIQHKTPFHWLELFTYTMFGWVDFRGDGKYKKENWVENFSTVWEQGEKRGSGKSGRKFSPWAHKIFPPKSGGKAMRENCTEAVLP